MARHHVLFDQAFLETRKFYMFADGEIPEINEKHGLDIRYSLVLTFKLYDCKISLLGK